MAAPSVTRPTVWIVDDNALDGERARRVLEGQYTVASFADGSTLLEHLTVHAAPDVLVLDWIMPGVSGIEVCRFLRGSPTPSSQLAILLLTMQTQTEQIVEGLGAGANDYLVKPYADPELLARVDALVRWNGLLHRARRAEARVVELLENSPDPLICVGSDDKITFANAGAQDLLGKDGDELRSRTLTELLPMLAAEDLDHAARSSRPLPDIEIGDQIFSPSVRSLPADANGEVTVALRDVTARRQKETRRLDFYSMMAHDLRSPLAAMLMRTDLILRGRRGLLTPELTADLRKMETHMRSLVALINDFLDFARMDEAAHKMERTRFDLAPLVGELIDDFQPLLDSNRQRVQLEIPDQIAVFGDRRRLQQVLTNLIANAIKFTPAGGNITVGAKIAGRRCEVRVEDDGPGISPSVLPTLFQRYTRGPDASQAGGSGLGLLIVREIIEAHGGSVGVDSQPGHGSRFWFDIPSADGGPFAGAELSPPPPQ